MKLIDYIQSKSLIVWDAIRSSALGSTSTKAAPGNHTHDLSALGALMKDQNLSDLGDVSAARDNLELGDSATHAASDFATAAQGAKADSALQPDGDGSSLTGITKAQVGLSNVDNTSDTNKPVSTAQADALALKAALAGSASQAFSTSTAASGSDTTIAATTAFVQSAIPVVPCYFTLSSTGTGSGVSTLELTCVAPTVLTIAGGGKFYTDSAGTLGETTSHNLIAGLNTIYIKVTGGKSVCKIAQGLFVSAINHWTSGTNAASLSLSLKQSPAGLVSVLISGLNTVFGDLSDASAGLTYMSITGSNTISGDLSDAPAGLVVISIAGSVAISGDISGIPASVTYFYLSGLNTVSGNLSNSPAGITYISILGSNTCTYNTSSGLRTWPSGMREVYCRSSIATSLTSAMIDALLIDLAEQSTWASEKTINLKGERTSASDAAYATLSGYGVAVNVSA